MSDGGLDPRPASRTGARLMRFLKFLSGKGIADDNGNEFIIFSKTAAARNEITVANAATGNSPSITASGSDTNVKLLLNGKGTGGGEIEGTATNDSASAGYVGEAVTATLAVGSKITLASGTADDVTSVSLTAGDWDVWATVVFQPSAGTTVNYAIGSISDTTDTINFTPPNLTYTPYFAQVVASYATDPNFTVGPIRVSIASTTTYYLVAQAGFGVSSCFAYGGIIARRRR